MACYVPRKEPVLLTYTGPGNENYSLSCQLPPPQVGVFVLSAGGFPPEDANSWVTVLASHIHFPDSPSLSIS